MKNRIEICGGIASGKTSLAKLLEENNIGTSIYEDFQSNPFWEAFYTDTGKYIFETELTFTLQHYHEIKKHLIDSLLICDYSILLDIAYAKIGLSGKKLELFKLIIKEIYQDINKPKMTIYLKCSAQEEQKRIKTRNRAVEENITIEFLENLNTQIKQEVSTLKPNEILIIDSLKYDFVNNEKDKKIVLNLIKENMKVGI